MSFAQVQLLGNVGRDPEMSYTPDGTAVSKFSVAVSRKVKGEEQTTWYNCIAWRKLGETINEHVHKGDMLFLQGSLEPRQYTTKDGRNGTSLDVVIDKFAFAGGKKSSAQAADSDPLGDLEDHPF